MQADRPASTRSSPAPSAASSLAPKTVESGRVVCVSGPSAMPTVLCYNFLKRGVAQIGVKTRLRFGNHSTPGSYLPTGLACINIHDPLLQTQMSGSRPVTELGIPAHSTHLTASVDRNVSRFSCLQVQTNSLKSTR